MSTEWLIGENGLFRGSPERGWTRVGPYAYCVNGVASVGDALVVAAETGCWRVPREGRWVQWHDETLTSVLAVAAVPVGVGIAAASAFGLATGVSTSDGAVRWTSHSDPLPVNARYSNALLADPADPLRWIVGTEAGVLIREHAADRWHHTSLAGRPVRALCAADGAFWAGADGGVWRSADGLTWARAGAGLDDAVVYSIAWTGDRLVVGLEGGLAVGDGESPWVRSGPALRVRTVAAAADAWLAGASPGGLWVSEDAGRRWRKSGDFVSVRTVVAEER